TIQRIFLPYKVDSDDVGVSLFQFFDDVILVRDYSEKNILAIKCVLRLFEICFSLKVNFSKRKLIGVNVIGDEIKVLANLLNCKVRKHSFSYLGSLWVGPSTLGKSTRLNEIMCAKTNLQIDLGSILTLISTSFGNPEHPSRYTYWQNIYNWLDFSLAPPSDPIDNFLMYMGFSYYKKSRKILSIIWLIAM
ncbi:hypothetical protein Lal_00009247, partial [Lupinus albus]